MREYVVVQRFRDNEVARCECGNYASYRVIALDAQQADGTWPWSSIACGQHADREIWAGFLASRRFSSRPTWETV